MSAISLKSITGITSITTPAGVDNVFTVHTNDTTERFRIDQSGNQNISGIVTATSFVGNVIGNISGGTVAGSTGTFSGDVSVAGDFQVPDVIKHQGDVNTKIRFPADDTFSVETAGSERLRIDSSGNSIFKGSGTDVTISPTDGLINFGMDGRTSFVTGTNACYIRQVLVMNYT